MRVAKDWYPQSVDDERKLDRLNPFVMVQRVFHRPLVANEQIGQCEGRKICVIGIINEIQNVFLATVASITVLVVNPFKLLGSLFALVLRGSFDSNYSRLNQPYGFRDLGKSIKNAFLGTIGMVLNVPINVVSGAVAVTKFALGVIIHPGLAINGMNGNDDDEYDNL
ncbi:MAG: hypothetical protein H7A37_05225 [Chlamydiales bacterium]|nr:hypothetical protein [Chlamydiia bacterium]MCP5507681.1 hypothetical protein [Chlamydiales bacterium]